MKDEWPREKKWRNLYTRSIKVKRASQLGIEYPQISEQDLIDNEIVNVLFICSMNKWRSPTAEKIYSKHPLVNARSAGTSKQARRTITVGDIKWADILIVMEQKHRERLQATFRQEVRHKELHVLEIEDRYQFMDPLLVEELKVAIAPILMIDDDDV
ncbi:MAG: hypothetical protein AAF226_03295 [Verrucomicrobiota bacterium]